MGRLEFDAAVAPDPGAALPGRVRPGGHRHGVRPAAPNTLPRRGLHDRLDPGSARLPGWPAPFPPVLLHSADGAPFSACSRSTPASPRHRRRPRLQHARLCLGRPLGGDALASGYNVIAADQRDFSFESSRGLRLPRTGCRRSAGRSRRTSLRPGSTSQRRPGVSTVGVVGFSEGAQNTVLALALTQALVARLLRWPDVQRAGRPGHADLLDRASRRLRAAGLHVPGDRRARRARRPAVHVHRRVRRARRRRGDVLGTPARDPRARVRVPAQTQVRVPLLNFYAADDPLVPPSRRR